MVKPFYDGTNSLDGAALRVQYDTKGKYGAEIAEAIQKWNSATWKGRGTGITIAGTSFLTKSVKVEVIPDHKFNTAQYRRGKNLIEINDAYFSGIPHNKRVAIIAHELGHAMVLNHGCKDTLMRGDGQINVDGPTGFDVGVLQLFHP